MNKILVLVAFCAILISSPVLAKKYKTVISGDYSRVTMSIGNARSGSSKAAYIYFNMKQIDGMIAVCGAFQMISNGKNTRGGNFRTMLPQFLRKRSFTYSGAQLKMTAGHFKAISTGSPIGQQATCRLTRTKWQNGMDKNNLDFNQGSGSIRF